MQIHRDGKRISGEGRRKWGVITAEYEFSFVEDMECSKFTLCKYIEFCILNR